MADISTKYLEKARDEAKQYAEKFLEECETVSNSYAQKDKFYKELTFKEQVLMVIYIVIGISGLIFYDKIFGYANHYFGGRWNVSLLGKLIMTLYIALAVGLIVLGLWNVFLLFYSVNTRREIRKIKQLGEELKKEVETLEKLFVHFASKLLISHVEMKIANATDYENILGKYKKKAEDIGVKTSQMKVIFYEVGFTLLFLFHFIFLGKYAVYAMSFGYTYQSTLVLICAYMLLLVLVYKLQLYIYEYAKKHTRLVAVGAFAAYQIVMTFAMAKEKMFVPLSTVFVAEILEELPEAWMPVLGFALKCLFTKGSIILITTSVIMIMFIFRTNIAREIEAIENGIEIPYDNGSKRAVNVAEIRSGNKWAYIFSVAYVIIIPKFMSDILINGASFGRIILYLILGAVWFAISKSFSGIERDTIYGKRLKWIKNGMFLSYMFLTLSLVPGFGIGSVVAILVQSILSIIVFGILMVAI